MTICRKSAKIWLSIFKVKNYWNFLFFFNLQYYLVQLFQFLIFSLLCLISKGQLISKRNSQAEDSPEKRTNEFVFTSMRRVFVRFLGES